MVPGPVLTAVATPTSTETVVIPFRRVPFCTAWVPPASATSIEESVIYPEQRREDEGGQRRRRNADPAAQCSRNRYWRNGNLRCRAVGSRLRTSAVISHIHRRSPSAGRLAQGMRDRNCGNGGYRRLLGSRCSRFWKCAGSRCAWSMLGTSRMLPAGEPMFPTVSGCDTCIRWDSCVHPFGRRIRFACWPPRTFFLDHRRSRPANGLYPKGAAAGRIMRRVAARTSAFSTASNDTPRSCYRSFCTVIIAVQKPELLAKLSSLIPSSSTPIVLA